MGIPKFLETAIIKGVLNGVASSHDTKTTVLGVVAAGIVASQVDWGKLFAKDPNEISKVAGAVVVAAIGYYTNKPNPSNTPTNAQPLQKASSPASAGSSNIH